jgi:hypothetical protein
MRKLLIVLHVLLFSGCAGVEEFPLAATSGTVTCDGKPVAKAIVFFEPLPNSSSAVIGKQGYALTDENGKFVVSTYGDNDGAVIGTHKVRVGSSETTPKCDCALLADVPVMEVEVKAGVANTFELVLNKATAADKLREQKQKQKSED